MTRVAAADLKPPPLPPVDDDRTVYRDGKSLVVRRGTDVSAVCMKCGQTAVGPGEVRKLSTSGGGGSSGGSSDLGDGIFAVIWLVILLVVLVVWIVSLFVALRDRRERTVVVGLCEQHQRLRTTMRRVGVGGWWAVVAATVVGVIALARPPHTTAVGVPVGIACGAAVLGGMISGIVGLAYPTLALRREVKDRMWVTGFGPAVLDALPVWPAAKPAKGVAAATS